MWFTDVAYDERDLKIAETNLLSLAKATHQKVILYISAEQGTPVPSSELRKKTAALYDRLEDELACVMTVLKGAGFWASASRSIMVGITLTSRRRVPMKVAGSDADAAEQLTDFALDANGEPVSLPALQDAIRVRHAEFMEKHAVRRNRDGHDRA